VALASIVGVAGCELVDGLVDELAGKRTYDCPTLALDPLWGSTFLHMHPDPIPDIRIEDWRMQPLLDDVLVPIRPA
jgi:hypothetical protein